jgi:hypothetical protein
MMHSVRDIEAESSGKRLCGVTVVEEVCKSVCHVDQWSPKWGVGRRKKINHAGLGPIRRCIHQYVFLCIGYVYI